MKDVDTEGCLGRDTWQQSRSPLLGTMYPNYPSFSANYLLSKVTPEVPAGTQIGEHSCHEPTAAYSTMSSSSQ